MKRSLPLVVLLTIGLAATALAQTRAPMTLAKGTPVVVVGEKAYDAVAQFGSWYYDEGFFLGGSKGTSRGAVGLSPDKPGINYKDNWGSAHQVGVFFLFGDGSVRMLTFGTEAYVMAALLTPDGGEAISPP